MAEINDCIMKHIQDRASWILENSKFCKVVRDGHLSPPKLKSYLGDVLWMLRQTEIQLRSAAKTSISLGQDELANFFLDKVDEENGHDQWAMNDLGRLQSNRSKEDISPSQAVVKLMNRTLETALSDPKRYLIYMIWAEAFTVVAGTELRPYLKKSNLNENAISSVYKHVELDQFHVKDDLVIIGNIFSNEATKNLALQSIDEFSQLTNSFLDAHAEV